MKVEIWSDIACPWCYIGKRRFEQAAAQFEHGKDIEVSWHSFELQPDAPQVREESLVTALSRSKGMKPEQAAAMVAHVAEVGRGDGLTLDFDRVRGANTFLAHQLIHLAAAEGLQDAAKERLLRAYFTEGATVSDLETLVRLAGEIGLDPDRARSALDKGEFADAVRADEREARQLGVRGVPFFVIDRRYAISGAQPAEAFVGALRKAWSESHEAPAEGTAEGAACSADGCDVPS
ncbi:DsbA family oxidoreductase [Chondromyces apiculatus]|uniref:2-hydroxychromene-2-carboxylate isomerase/DsbA-like thioredoxin domain protein n=1 Tax=Chondromyces apiculatus DSM 436 TaxID=1192034 RepID=A0A017TBX5_9BACT|nr:DsbA family oxidoreductase [Chondromyces apiculatus]EYF06749.1 2-hydroxychromene-2-carboxylate isomerase/DsbA-like thioredoxin domain protein [Chondromyces apiculatus DSM 436]